MIEPHADRQQAITLGAVKAYDAEDFVNELRSMKVTPHVAQNTALIRLALAALFGFFELVVLKDPRRIGRSGGSFLS